MKMEPELLQRARAHLAAEHYGEAGAIANVYAQEVEPHDPEAHLILSRAAQATGRPQIALWSAANALILAPEDPLCRERFNAALGRLAITKETPPILARGARMLLDRLAAPGSQQGTGGSGNGAIDLVLPMKGPYGSELNLIETARIVRRHAPARIWSTIQPHPHLLELDPSIQMITPDNIPSGDTMAFMGLFAEPPGWLERTRPRRIVLRYNVWHISDLLRWLGAASRTSAEEIDVVYPSHAIKAGLGLDGPVIQTFIDFDHFADRRPASEVLSVGRLSRDEIGKHHPQDPALYRALVGLGLEVRIMGGTKLAPFVQQNERMKLLASLAVPAREFIHGLGLFYYRTGSFYEAFGRVVMEAMASGLPVVCHKAGGYAEMIDSGENGFLFETSEEAVETISRLRGDGNLVRRIGEAARETVRAMHSRAYEDRLIVFLTGS